MLGAHERLSPGGIDAIGAGDCVKAVGRAMAEARSFPTGWPLWSDELTKKSNVLSNFWGVEGMPLDGHAYGLGFIPQHG
jgi:hypothetical protein